MLVYYSAPTDAGVRTESPLPDYKQTPESAPRRIGLHVGIRLIVGVIVIAFIASILLSNSFLGPKVGITTSVLRNGSRLLTRVGYLLM